MFYFFNIVADKIPDSDKFKFSSGETSVRVCLEFSMPGTFYSASTDRVYLQGQVKDGKFD